MTDESTIHINFSRPIPLFVLDSVTLLPQQLLPIQISQQRDKKLFSDALDGSGLIAMAIRDTAAETKHSDHPAVRPATCIGQIVQHESLPDGRFHILIQGICRARIINILNQDSAALPYRFAMLAPLESGESSEQDLAEFRDRLDHIFTHGPLTQLVAADSVAEVLHNEQIPTAAILELLSFTLLGDSELRYQLLAEPSPTSRALVISTEIDHLSNLLAKAQSQIMRDLPKGCSWN